MQRYLAAIMFTDITGYTSLMQRNELLAIQWRNRHRSEFDRLHQKYHGDVVQYFGDGTLSVFSSAVFAVKCAIELQQVLQQEPKVPLRIGIHSGDIIRRDDEIIGDAVNVASRIESLAEPGSVLVSRSIYKQIANQDFDVISLGNFELRNVLEPIEIFSVRAEGLVSASPRHETGQEKQIPKAPDKTIAILPFVNMSNDMEQEYFCDGITEEIINSLSHVEDLSVIARTSAFMFKNKNEDIREIGRTLNVANILEGSVRKSGNLLRITSQLINADDGSHLWSERYDRELSDVFEIQDEISIAIVDALKIKLIGEEKAQLLDSHTNDIEAYNLYLMGQFEWYKRTREGMMKSIDLFKEALVKDPKYTLAKVGIAYAYLALFDWGELHLSESLPMAQTYLEEAESTDPELADTYIAKGYLALCNWDIKSYQHNYHKALALNPKNPLVYHLHTVANSILGAFEIGMESNNIARRLDPLSAIFNFSFGHAQLLSTRYDIAANQFKYILTINPHFKPAALFGTYALLQGSREKEAVEMLKRMFFEEEQEEKIIQQIDKIYRKEGIDAIVRWLATEGIKFYGHPLNHSYHQAVCYAWLGDADQTFDLLLSLYEIRSFRLSYFRSDPLLSKFKDDPRYRKLEQDIGIWNDQSPKTRDR